MDGGLIALGAGLGAGLVTIGAALGIGKITEQQQKQQVDSLKLLEILEQQLLSCQR